MRRLREDPEEVDPETLIAGCNFHERASRGRPYTIVNFASSADGRATIDGRSGGLGDEGDKQIFRALRGVADAVLVGTGTLRAERYGRIIRDPERRRVRELRGLPAEPIAVTVTRSGHVPTDIPLFAEPEARIVVFTAAPVDLSGVRASVETITMEPDQLTMPAVLEALRARHDVRVTLCEGGPTLFGDLLRQRVADELFITVAPKLVAGAGAAITAGPVLPAPAELTLQWTLMSGQSLHLRYAITTTGSMPNS